MIDIIIRAKDGHELTDRCVQSILDNTPSGDYRIILVDDGSAPPYAFDVDFLVRHQRSLGAVSATNSGLAISLQQEDSDYVIVMDNDTEVPEGDVDWLSRFVAEMEEYPDTGALGATSHIVNQPQQILHSPRTYTADWFDEKKKAGGSKHNPPVVWFVSFCCMLRKDAIKQVGLWDTRYNPGNWEDTDYAVALRAAGWAVRVCRSVYIHHRGHQTFGANLMKLLETNQQKFIEKWGAGRLIDLQVLSPEAMKGAS